MPTGLKVDAGWIKLDGALYPLRRSGGSNGSTDQPYDVIVGLIQSNVRGAAQDWSAADQYDSPRINMWHWASSSIQAAIEPLSTPDAGTGMGVMNTFVKDYVAESLEPGRKVLIVNAARGGTGFTLPSTNPAGSAFTWDHNQASDANNLAVVTRNQLQSIMSQLPAGSRIVAFIANHGSTDGINNTPKATFKALLEDWITWIRTQLSVPTIPYLMMQMRPQLFVENRHNNIDQAQQEVALDDNNFVNVVHVASPNGSEYNNADVVHFNALGVRTIGHNLYSAYQSLVSETPGPDPEIAGALPLGEANYAIPTENTIYIASNGSDSNNGLTEGAPKATFTSAVAACGTSGWTIVVRGGVYNHKLTSGNLTKNVTIQNYPGEQVWFEGVTTVTSWTNNGDGTWYCTPPAVFSHGADYSGTGDASRWIDSETVERAFWPEMIFIDNVQQSHTEGTVTTGKFKVDYDANRIYIGTNPAGKTVKVTNYDRLLATTATVTLRGIGFRRYAAPMVNSGAITGTTGSVLTLENCHFTEFPIDAVRAWGTQCTIRYCTFTNIGQNAAGGQQEFIFENNYINGTNKRLFKREPTSAGVKVSHTNGAIFRHNWITNTTRTFGIWLDVSCYDSIILNNHIDTAYCGVFHEISRKALVVNNYLTNIENVPLYALDAGETEFWLNYADRGGSFDAFFKGDNRQNNVSPGQDVPFAGAQNWAADKGVCCNNIFSNITNKSGVWRFIAYNSDVVEDSWHYFDRVAGNLWTTQNATSSTTSVARLFAVEDASGTNVTYTSNSAFQAAAPTGKVGNNMVVQATAVSASHLTPSQIDSLCDPLPAKIATLVGVSTGSKILGPVLPEPTPRVPTY